MTCVAKKGGKRKRARNEEVREREGDMSLDARVKMLIWSRPLSTYLKGQRASRRGHTHRHTQTSAAVKFWAPNYVNPLSKK